MLRLLRGAGPCSWSAAAPDAPVVLLGHSIGGHTVLEAARQRPALGVALLAPVNLSPHRALMDERYFTRVRPLLRLLDHPLLGAPIAAFSEFFLKRVLGFPKHVTRREIVHTNRRVALIDWVESIFPIFSTRLSYLARGARSSEGTSAASVR